MLIENNKLIGTVWTFVNIREYSEAESLAYQSPSAKSIINSPCLKLYEVPQNHLDGSEWLLSVRLGKGCFWNAFWTPQRVVKHILAPTPHNAASSTLSES